MTIPRDGSACTSPAPHDPSVVDTGHEDVQFTSAASGVTAGRVKCSVIGVNAVAETISYLEWWQDRMRYHCLQQVGDGMHFEQRWLDVAPAFINVIGQKKKERCFG